MGLLLTDLQADFAMTRLVSLASDALNEMQSGFAALENQAEAWFAREKIDGQARELKRAVDMRYAGQNYELAVTLPHSPITADSVELLARGFAQAHERMYGFVAESEPVQLVTFRLEALGRVRKAEIKAEPLVGPDASSAIREHREVWIGEENRALPCPIYERERLKPGNAFAGPAVVEQMDATTFVLPGMRARVDAHANIVLEAP
jgi:N-methylhydantoinase A